MDWITDPQAWLALLTLTILEIILGIDNIVFISILAGRLPKEKQASARRTGLILAVITRLLLLFSVTWVMKLTAPLFGVLGTEISWRDLILLGGGLFLLGKATREIHKELEGHKDPEVVKATATMGGVILQILILDMIFSLDSVITAVGMADDIAVMAIAVVIAVGFMLWFAKTVSDFIQRHPTFKMLALSFLLLIGVALVAEGLELHIPKGYIYFAMAFSVFVEILNMRISARRGRVKRAAPSEG